MIRWRALDLDGTIAFCGYRDIFYVSKPRNNDAAEAGVIFDVAYKPVLEDVLKAQREGCSIVILTARSVFCANDTAVWISRHGIKPIEIVMKPHMDFTSTEEFKGKQLDRLIEKYGKPELIYEDDLDNIVMMQAKGLLVKHPEDFIHELPIS